MRGRFRDHFEALQHLRECALDPERLACLRRAAYDAGLLERSDDSTLQGLAWRLVLDEAPLSCCTERAGTRPAGGGGAYETPTTERPDAPTPAPSRPRPPPLPSRQKTWIEIELVDSNGKPVPGQGFELYASDGSLAANGNLDTAGRAHIGDLDPDEYKVTFPDLDKSSWAR
jgi:hypothetical protein